MTLPFWPFSKIAFQSAEIADLDESYSKSIVECLQLRRELAECRAQLRAQDSALLVVQAIDASTGTISATISCLKDEIVKAIDTSGSKVAHATGAVATAQDKASNVQREWLEVSRGNR